MYRNRWSGSRWWRDNIFSPPFSGSGRWKNTWSEKRRKKRAAWQAAFDYLPDLDDVCDAAALLTGSSSREMVQSQQLIHNDGMITVLFVLAVEHVQSVYSCNS